MRKGIIKLAEVSNLKRKFKDELCDRKKGNKNTRNASIIENTKILFNAWEKVLKLYHYYAELISEAKSRFLQGKGIKLLTPKQML